MNVLIFKALINTLITKLICNFIINKTNTICSLFLMHYRSFFIINMHIHMEISINIFISFYRTYYLSG